jgi:ABC-type sugar transport system ATPase subunit
VSQPAHGVVIRGLHKRYGDTIALNGLDLEARPGEILGIAGPNGAGKSTMVKILAGEVERDEGEILVDGMPWSHDFGADRVAVVHQEPQLFPNLTVGENVLAGREGNNWRWPRNNAGQRRLLGELGIDSLRDVPLSLLGLAAQQRTEIARALTQDASLVLFDEPNSALTPDESRELFRLMRRLADSGRVVMLISHRLTELAANSNRVGVILDGRCVRTLEGAERTAEEIAETLVSGLEQAVVARDGASGETAGGDGLRFEGLSDRGGAFVDLDLTVPAGAVTALVGVEGSGAREIVRAAAGLRRVSGTCIFEDRPLRPSQLASHVAYLSADRASSLFTNLTVGENLVIRLDNEISRGVLGLRRRRMRSLARQLCAEFQVKSDGIDLGIRSLSGGNQQKVAIAAAVARKPDVLALEEPTRGVDIASKAEIYEILRTFAVEGKSVLLYCTEIPEVYEIADRLHVVSDGRLSQPLEVAGFANMEVLAKTVASLERHGAVAA